MMWVWASDSMHMQSGIEIHFLACWFFTLCSLLLVQPFRTAQAQDLCVRTHPEAKHPSSISPCCVQTVFNNLLSLLTNPGQLLVSITYLDQWLIFLHIWVFGMDVLHVPVGAFLCVWSLLACGMVQQLSGAALWSVTFVWIGNVDLFRLKRHELESLVRTHDQKCLFALCQSTLLSPCEADVK